MVKDRNSSISTLYLVQLREVTVALYARDTYSWDADLNVSEFASAENGFLDCALYTARGVKSGCMQSKTRSMPIVQLVKVFGLYFGYCA